MYGLIAGFISFCVWVGVLFITGYEVGPISIGIGIVIGLIVHVGAIQDDIVETGGPGVAAGVCAFGAILAAKLVLLVVVFIAPGEKTQTVVTDEMMIAEQASMFYVGKVNWPEGVTAETASRKEDFPPEIWAKSEQLWNSYGKQVQAKKKAERELELYKNQPAEIAGAMDVFRWWDILWFGLAFVLAFGIAEGANMFDDE